MAMLANNGKLKGRKLLSKERLLAQTEPRPNPLEVDAGIGMVTSNGVGGYWVGTKHPASNPLVGSSPLVLAHGGAGGAFGWADLDAGIGVMINHNRMFGTLPEHPFLSLADAIREVTKG